MNNFTDLTNSGGVTQAQLIAMDEVRDVTGAPVSGDFLSTDIYLRDTVTNFLYEIDNGSVRIVGSNKITKLSSVTANAIARWNSATKELKDSGVTISDNDTISTSGLNSSLSLNPAKINTSIDTPQSTTAYTGTYGQIQIANSNQTDGNYARIDFGDGDTPASASIGAKLINHALNYANFEFYTRGADGFKSRMEIGSDGTASFTNKVSSSSYDINQDADSVGLKITGFDDKSSDYINAYIDPNGTSTLSSSKAFKNIVNGSNVFYTDSNGLRMYDDKYLMFGNDNDFRIKYDSTNNKMQIGAGNVDNLSIDTNGGVKVSSPTTGATLTVGRQGGANSIQAGSDANGGFMSIAGYGAGSVILNHYSSGDIWLASGGGRVGIGNVVTSSHTERIQLRDNTVIEGTLKVAGGSPAVGKVLTSDANGLASWTAPSGGGDLEVTLNGSFNGSSQVTVAHGVTLSNIKSVEIFGIIGGSYFPCNSTSSGKSFSYLLTPTLIVIDPEVGNSGSLLTNAFKVIIKYV